MFQKFSLIIGEVTASTTLATNLTQNWELFKVLLITGTVRLFFFVGELFINKKFNRKK